MEAELRARLERYLDLLLAANEQFNLTAISDRGAAWETLVVESLDLLPHLAHLGAGARVVDVGSGAGVPALPLALARPDLDFTLIEATHKKARFLEAAAAELALAHVRVLHGRAETLGHERKLRGQFVAATARAVGEMRELVELSLPLLGVGGVLLAAKGKKGEIEAQAAVHAAAKLGGAPPEVLRVDRASERTLVVVRVRKVARTPDAYPRPPGKPKIAPL